MNNQTVSTDQLKASEIQIVDYPSMLTRTTQLTPEDREAIRELYGKMREFINNQPRKDVIVVNPFTANTQPKH